MAGPAPRLAVDFSAGLIRVVDGALGGSLRCGSGGTPPGSLVGGKIVDAAGVAGALRQLLARTEIHATQALLAVSDALATFRVIRFPQSTPDQAIDSAVTKELPLDPERMATRWVDVHRNAEDRIVYAVAWDRALVASVVEVARLAGLQPTVVDLKSACIARTVGESSCVVLDMSSDPVEVILIDGYLPQVWHSFNINVPIGDDLGPALSGPLRSVLRFYQRRRDSDFGRRSPILIAGEQVIPSQVLTSLSQLLDHPVEPIPAPARVPHEVRHATYLTCLGLLMRRT